MKPLFCVAFAAALAALSSEARAETFVVTRFDDPLPDGCAVSDCSLREAAVAATANDPFGPTDIIQLAAGTYTLIRGELPIAKQGTEVVGASSAQTIITSDTTLFSSYSGAQARPLTLRGMQIRGLGFGNDELLLEDIFVPSDGSGISIGGEETRVEIRDSELRKPIFCNQSSGYCAIRNTLFFGMYVNPGGNDPSTATVLIKDSIVDGTLDPNPTLPSTIVLHDGASIDIEDSTITHSEVHVVRAGPPTNLRRVLYLDNLAQISADVPAEMLIEDSELRDNEHRAVRADNGSHWKVRGSSFVNNRVNGTAGGAIVVEGGATMDIRNSTFSGNSFTVDAASGGARGAAIGYRSGGASLLLRHVTIAAPTFLPTGIVGTAIGGFDGANASLDISNSIVRGTCFLDGALENNAGNVESPGNTCGFDTNASKVSVTSSDLALGVLGDHGGFTPTYEPAPDSVAVDGGGSQQCLPLDQRGYLRPAGDACDAGSVEVGAIDDTLFSDDFDG